MKPEVVIISGWGYPGAAWGEVTGALEPRCRCRVIEATAPDAIAPTQSGQPASAVHAPRVLVGWSMGAMLALRHAETARPLDGLLLISATARFCSDRRTGAAPSPGALRAMRLKLRRDRERTLFDFYALSASPHPPPTPLQCAGWSASLQSDLDALARGLTDLAEMDLRTPLPRPSAPVILLHGAEDRVVPVDAARALARDLPGARLDVIPAAGHDLPIHHPDLVVQAVVELLSAIDAAPNPSLSPPAP